MNYYELEPEQNTFKIISVQTTYRCQMHRANCYLGDMLNNEHYPDVDLNRLNDFMNRLPAKVNLRFIGAEPTMNTQLPDLIRMVREAGHRPTMLTNGLKLRRLPYVQELKEAGMRSLGLSMNGGLDDRAYMDFDNGKYARAKIAALDNCMKMGIIPHVNTIIDPTNVHILPDLIAHIDDLGQHYGRRFGVRFPVALRLKSIGKLGTFRDTYTYSLDEMIKLMSNIHGRDITPTVSYVIDGVVERNTCVYPLELKSGTMYVKLTDWSLDDTSGIPDPGSQRRGILTDTYRVAPFFEYYEKEHEQLTNSQN